MLDKKNFKQKYNNCPICDSRDILQKTKIQNKYDVDKCQSCGFIFINPMPTDEFLHNHYNSNFNHQFLIRPQRQKENEEIIQMMIKHLGFKNHSEYFKINFYEIGIGKGDFIRQIAKKGFSVKGSDLSGDMASDSLIHLENGIFADFGYENVFDIVYSSHVLEHSNDPELFVKSIHKSLKKGGIAVIRVPNYNSSYNLLGNLLLGKFKWQNYLPAPDHLIIFNKKNYAKLFEKYGFKIEKNTTFPLISNLLLSYLSIIGRAVFLRYKEIKNKFSSQNKDEKKEDYGVQQESDGVKKLFNFFTIILGPIDKIWVKIVWPIFRRFNMGEELLIIAKK